MWQKRPNSQRTKERDILREHFVHQQRLCRVSSRIDNSSPRCMSHVTKNLKGKLLEKSRKEEINSKNQLLVNKLLKVNSRDSSVRRSTQHPSFMNRSKKIEEISKITNENYRILNKIKKSKPHYSSERLRKEYRYATTLKSMISQNSGRVPKIVNYTQFEFNFNGSGGIKSARSLHNSGRLDNFL